MIFVTMVWTIPESSDDRLKVKLVTLVEGNPKAPFSMATTPRAGHYFFPWIAPLYLWSLPYNAEC